LAKRFDVVCGGAAGVDTMGFHLTPSWRGEAIWLPALPPLDGPAAAVLPAVQELLEGQVPLWIPVVLRWEEELADGLSALGELAAFLGEQHLARSWDDFLLAARASRTFAAVSG
ncbi:MAG: hypothetical protein JWM31_3564, partial [Solirubrobacterales bacterium]|nr:hypothetical protein [Solirubrobacterales bacterium]